MPVLKITSNTRVPSDKVAGFLKQCSTQVASILSKPESYVMVSYQHNANMLFAGQDHPMAYLELKSIALPQDKTTLLSEQLCSVIQAQLGTPFDRVYIEFSDAQRHMFGWNGKTFAD